MEGQGEAAADVITGGVIARAVEPAAGEAHKEGQGHCLNCGAVLTGAYCSNCGQSSHPHRSLSSLGHDILHGVLHFEGKVWKTLPELFFRPGRLTRRYIDGERAKFVSPIALYLFSVFLMFAVFPFTSNTTLMPKGVEVLGVGEQWKENIADNIEKLDERIQAQREQLAEDDLTTDARAEADKTLTALMAEREVQRALLNGSLTDMAEFARKQEENAKAEAAKQTPAAVADVSDRLKSAVKHASDNPALLAYKLKTTGYKFSWALIPLSVPFMWLLFFWRRDIHAYDHAIFVTYSITFMMLFVVLLTVADTVGVPGVIWGIALAVIPPLHLYKQLRGAYGLSRFGAWVRLFLLSIMIIFVLTLFGTLLVALGMSG